MNFCGFSGGNSTQLYSIHNRNSHDYEIKLTVLSAYLDDVSTHVPFTYLRLGYAVNLEAMKPVRELQGTIFLCSEKFLNFHQGLIDGIMDRGHWYKAPQLYAVPSYHKNNVMQCQVAGGNLSISLWTQREFGAMDACAAFGSRRVVS